jgi:hypothetical protein
VDDQQRLANLSGVSTGRDSAEEFPHLRISLVAEFFAVGGSKK